VPDNNVSEIYIPEKGKKEKLSILEMDSTLTWKEKIGF